MRRTLSNLLLTRHPIGTRSRMSLQSALWVSHNGSRSILALGMLDLVAVNRSKVRVPQVGSIV